MFPKIKIKPLFNEGLPLTPNVLQIFLTDLLLKTKVPQRFLNMTIIGRSKLHEQLFAQVYGSVTFSDIKTCLVMFLYALTMHTLFLSERHHILPLPYIYYTQLVAN